MRLVLDWDGTVTERDTLEALVERFGDIETYRGTGRLMGRSLTHDEALARSVATVRAPLDEVVGWLLATVPLRPGFRELVERHRPLVVSSGFHELIEPILESAGVEVELHANRVEPRADGWRVLWRYGDDCDTCGESCKPAVAEELAGEGELVYVGDGYSDRCAAELADRVFATRGLARWLEERGLPYEPFDDFHDVARALDGRA